MGCVDDSNSKKRMLEDLAWPSDFDSDIEVSPIDKMPSPPKKKRKTVIKNKKDDRYLISLPSGNSFDVREVQLLVDDDEMSTIFKAMKNKLVELISNEKKPKKEKPEKPLSEARYPKLIKQSAIVVLGPRRFCLGNQQLINRYQ